MENNIRITTAEQQHIPKIAELLSDADLPTEDIFSAPITFYMFSVKGKMLGISGLEVYEDCALLRSVVVDKASQGRSFGRNIVDLSVRKAKEKNVRSLYLLTTTAAGFFEKLGFVRTVREEAPEVIKNTQEFSNICPDSAVCMKLML